jgi:phospholipase/carboxylesterase
VKRFGELGCHLVGEESGTGPLVVLLHGFGAPGNDLVPLARMLEAQPGTRFLFPQAPVELPPALFGRSRAWWMIDLGSAARHGIELPTGRGVDMSRQVPRGMSKANRMVSAMLDEAVAALEPSSVVLGGFSQGAMLSLDVALRGQHELAGLVLWSGTLVAASEWRPLMAGRAGTRVFQSHGRQDPLLPFSSAETVRDDLRRAGLDVTWFEFDGGHEIPPPALRGAGELIASADSLTASA